MNNSPEQFYDELADIYDGMTQFGPRLLKAEQILTNLKNQFNFKTALDVACGTGLHVCALERIGVTTTGIDISEQMLNRAKQNAAQTGVSPLWIKSGMENLSDEIKTSTDAIFCLGNSIPHILEENQFYNIANSFRALLKNNGILVLQLLNYSRILAAKNRIVNIAKTDKKSIIRFYDFIAPFIQFNILTYWNETEKYEHKLQSTKLYPYTVSQIIRLLEKANFSEIKTYSSLELNSFDEEKSKDLVIIAKV